MIGNSEIVELKITDRIEGIVAVLNGCHKMCDALEGSQIEMTEKDKPITPGLVDLIEQRLIEAEKQAAELSERLGRITRRL